MKHLFLVYLFIWSAFSCSIGFAQGTTPSRENPLMREITKIGRKASLRPLWSEGGADQAGYAALYWDPEFRKLLGISDEKLEEIKKAPRLDDEELQKLTKEMNKYYDPKDPHFSKASEQTKRNYLQAYEKHYQYLSNASSPKLDRFLTPEQMKLMKETQLSLMPESSIPNPASFEALDLSEEQKEQMKTLQKEMEPEFEKMLEEKVELVAQIGDKIREAMRAKGINATDVKAFNENIERVLEELSKDKDFTKLQSQEDESGRDLVQRFKFRMFDVLTDEQMDRLSKLINHPSEYVKKKLAEMRKEREETEQDKTWRPGPSSWQPGDPIPEEYQIHRKNRGRFPQKKK